MKKTVVVSFLFSLIFFALNWHSDFGWASLIFALVPGPAMVASQRYRHSCQFAPRLIVGSLLFGIVTTLLIEVVFYMTTQVQFQWSRLVHEDGATVRAALYVAMSILGGLGMILAKGFIELSDIKKP